MKSNSLYLFQPVLFFFTILLFLGTVSPQLVKGQSFEEGMEYYQEGEYAKAAALFDKIHTNRGLLFAGKAYWGANDFATARSRLLNVAAVNGRQLSMEADYTLSLIDIEQKKFGDALSRLYMLSNQQQAPRGIASESERLYEGLLRYLTFQQRLDIMDTSEQDALLYDLASTAMGRVDYDQAQILFTKMRNMTDEIPSSKMDDLSSLLENETRYSRLENQKGLEAFDGLTHTIGIALPAYSPEKREYSVSRGLYMGFALAAEEFNKQNDVKINFVYENTGVEADSAQQALESLTATGADAILGPLFSNRAKTMSAVSEEYQTPVIAPLANSSSITKEDGYFYQINPPLDVHGKNMAEYAYESLNINNVAVIAQRGSSGALSAKAFRDAFEDKGANVPHFYIEDLGQRGEGLSRYARYLTGSSQGDALSAIYAPFTGETASSLIDHLLRQLNTLESNITILGSPDWANRNFSANKIGQRAVYFTESFYTRPNDIKIDRFNMKFRNRFNIDPNRFAIIGYDTATFLLKAIENIANPQLLQEELGNQPSYKGLITNIDFQGSNINQDLMFFKITDQNTYLVGE